MLCIWLVFVVLALVANAPAMGRFDQRMTTRIQRRHGAWRDRLARSATFLGNTEILLAIGLVVAGYLLATSRRWAALFSALGLLGMPISGALKHLVRRQRPQSEIARVVLPVVGLSFPSGHAMTTLMFYGFIAFLIAVHARSAYGTFWVAVLSLLILLISWSRIYLGAHWFSDVVGGLAGGSFFLLLMTLLYRTLAVGEILTR
jgi:undecaprenyl-diphosphatase